MFCFISEWCVGVVRGFSEFFWSVRTTRARKLATHNRKVNTFPTHDLLPMATFWEALYGGINPAEVPGHGGAECVAYLSNKTKIFETCLSTTIMLIASVYAFKRFTLPAKPPPEGDHFWKGPLLALLSAVFGLQIGYKISSGQLMYMLNPCHFLTMVEVLRVARNCVSLHILCHYRYIYWHQSLPNLLYPSWGCWYIMSTVHWLLWCSRRLVVEWYVHYMICVNYISTSSHTIHS